MSAFVQPDRSGNPIFCPYLVENDENQLLTLPGTPSQSKRKD